MTFIHDHKRKLWASPLKTKDQVLSVFKEFHMRVERETGRKLKAIRADNGGEYRGQFEEYCQSKGIWLEYIVPKMPELNGLAERMNRTIMMRVRSMLAHAKLSKTFWAEVLTTATYMINRSCLAPFGRRCTTESVDRQRRLVPTSEGVRLSCLRACCKGEMGKVGPEDSPMHIPGIRSR